MDQTKDSRPAMGVALCQSLALEIYFKALVALHHDDVSLHSLLPEEFKNRLKAHQLPKLVSLMNPLIQGTLVRMFGIVNATPQITLEEFMQLLKDHAFDIFYSWRYLYEYDPDQAMRLDLTLLCRLINASQLTIGKYQAGDLEKWQLR